MCLGAVAHLAEVSTQDGVRVGRLDDGSEVLLAFVPEADAGAYLVIHLGIPVAVLDPEQADATLTARADAAAALSPGGST